MENSIVQVKKGYYATRKRRQMWFLIALCIVPLLNFAIFWVYVNFDSIMMAFKLSTREGVIWSLKNFTRFFHEYSIPEYELALALKNTLLLFVVGTLIGLPTSLLFSYYLYKKGLFAKFFRVIFFLPSIMSAAVLVGLF